MLATVSGIVMLVNLLQLENAEAAMDVTLYQAPLFWNTAGMMRFSPSSPVYPIWLRLLLVTVNASGEMASV